MSRELIATLSSGRVVRRRIDSEGRIGLGKIGRNVCAIKIGNDVEVARNKLRLIYNCDVDSVRIVES